MLRSPHACSEREIYPLPLGQRYDRDSGAGLAAIAIPDNLSNFDRMDWGNVCVMAIGLGPRYMRGSPVSMGLALSEPQPGTLRDADTHTGLARWPALGCWVTIGI